MEKENVFKWKHYQPDIILLTVRWYLRYNLSFRDLVEMMEYLLFKNTWIHLHKERGDHPTGDFDCFSYMSGTEEKSRRSRLKFPSWSLQKEKGKGHHGIPSLLQEAKAICC